MIFKLAINNSSITQSFLSKSLSPITVEPSQIVDVFNLLGTPSALQLINDTFLNYLKKKKIKRFYIKRTYSLGDILMLVPVVRELRKRDFNPYLWTAGWVRPMLDLFGIPSVTLEQRFSPAEDEYGITVDMIVEGDHYRPELQVLHRCDIYSEVLGLGKMELKKLDWSLDPKKLPELGIDGDYICFQGAGAHILRQLPSESTNRIAHRLKEKGISVIIIDNNNRMPIERLFALIAGAKCLITMDSGPLWIAHFTRTPTVCLFGPTRPSEKMVSHPLWPQQAIGIRLNEYLDPPCESCFGGAQQCNNNVNCVKIEPDRIFDLIYSRIKEWL